MKSIPNTALLKGFSKRLSGCRSSSKKGQGMSLNVIIIAVLALIVLVVLVAIFMGRITIFQQDVDKVGQAELIKMKVYYGQCRPTATEEANLVTNLGAATDLESKEDVKATFSDEISRCKLLSDSKADCEGQGCRWSS